MIWLMSKHQELQEKKKSAICFYPMIPESSSGCTKCDYWKRLADKKVEDMPATDQNETISTLVGGPQKWSYIHNPQ